MSEITGVNLDFSNFIDLGFSPTTSLTYTASENGGAGAIIFNRAVDLFDDQVTGEVARSINSMTWEDLGVPAGATVNSVVLTSMKVKGSNGAISNPAGFFMDNCWVMLDPKNQIGELYIITNGHISGPEFSFAPPADYTDVTGYPNVLDAPWVDPLSPKTNVLSEYSASNTEFYFQVQWQGYVAGSNVAGPFVRAMSDMAITITYTGSNGSGTAVVTIFKNEIHVIDSFGGRHTGKYL